MNNFLYSFFLSFVAAVCLHRMDGKKRHDKRVFMNESFMSAKTFLFSFCERIFSTGSFELHFPIIGKIFAESFPRFVVS
jgi:hypothetical protein